MSQLTTYVIETAKQEATAKVMENAGQATGFLSSLSSGEALFLLIAGLFAGWIAYKLLAWVLKWGIILGLGAASIYLLLKVAVH
ncbi:MAG: hypothetical protein AABX70_05915 [Nanoarchaeota archaeon]